jgi:hypothetical protein
MLKILSANVQNLVVRATRNPEFVYPLTLPFMLRHDTMNTTMRNSCVPNPYTAATIVPASLQGVTSQ